MFRKGLEEEFNIWLDNTEFISEIFDKVKDLTDADTNSQYCSGFCPSLSQYCNSR